MTLQSRIESLLRAGVDSREARFAPANWRDLAIAMGAGGMLYGAAMGTFGGFGGDRLWQIAYSAVKVPLLLVVTLLLSLPGYCVLNTLSGLRHDLSRALAAVLTAHAGAAVVLGGLAPYPLFWYVSGTSYHGATLFNGLMFAIASFAGQHLLRRMYAPLIALDPRHRRLLRVWLVLYCFTGIQLAWVLRPFLGDPRAPVQFFREEAWGNAYVVVAQILWRMVAGR